MMVQASWEASFSDLYKRGWTDGLPVIPPTRVAVEAMIAGVALDPKEAIAELAPSGGIATLESIAVNAVMAGCKPEYLPVVVAAVRAICAPEFNLPAIQGTGDAVCPALIVNGPIRGDICVNSADGALGPGWRANATIGRAVRLVMQNVGKAQPLVGDFAIMGQPAKYSFCFGENQEASPWAPLHSDRGYSQDDSTVTAVAALFTEGVSPLVKTTEAVLTTLASAMTTIGHANTAYGAGPVTIVIGLGSAAILADAGYSKSDVKAELFRRARFPVAAFPTGERLWAFELVIQDEEVLTVRNCEDITLVVAGGHGLTSFYLGGWLSRPVTVRI